MGKLKILTAVILTGLMLLTGITAFAEDPPAPEPENGETASEDTGHEEQPEAPNVILPTGREDVYSLDTEPATQPETLNILLPYDISFDIVISTNNSEGIVASREFKIINKGENPATVNISSIDLDISDKTDFSISSTADLPEEGNNIYIELICTSGGESKALPVMKSFDGDAYTYYLESGDIGTFRLDGVVNEFGDTPWSGTNVRVSVCFNMEEHGTVIGPLKARQQAAEDDSDNAAESETAKEGSETEVISEPETSSEPEAASLIEEVSKSEQSGSESGDETSEEESVETGKETEKEPEKGSESENENSETKPAPEE